MHTKIGGRMSILLIVILVFVGLVFVLLFNGLINKKNQVTNAFAGIDAYLKKRTDLIPNLVSTVQTYMKHEKELLTKITDLRTKALSGNISNEERVAVENEITKTLGGIIVAVENYPDLKASQNFLQLQQSLNEIEEQISAARRAYNAAVTRYNNAIQMIPTNIMAKMMGYKEKKVFEISEQERQNVNVKSLFNQ